MARPLAPLHWASEVSATASTCPCSRASDRKCEPPHLDRSSGAGGADLEVLLIAWPFGGASRYLFVNAPVAWLKRAKPWQAECLVSCSDCQDGKSCLGLLLLISLDIWSFHRYSSTHCVDSSTTATRQTQGSSTIKQAHLHSRTTSQPIRLDLRCAARFHLTAYPIPLEHKGSTGPPSNGVTFAFCRFDCPSALAQCGVLSGSLKSPELPPSSTYLWTISVSIQYLCDCLSHSLSICGKFLWFFIVGAFFTLLVVVSP